MLVVIVAGSLHRWFVRKDQGCARIADLEREKKSSLRRLVLLFFFAASGGLLTYENNWKIATE